MQQNIIVLCYVRCWWQRHSCAKCDALSQTSQRSTGTAPSLQTVHGMFPPLWPQCYGRIAYNYQRISYITAEPWKRVSNTLAADLRGPVFHELWLPQGSLECVSSSKRPGIPCVSDDLIHPFISEILGGRVQPCGPSAVGNSSEYVSWNDGLLQNSRLYDLAFSSDFHVPVFLDMLGRTVGWKIL